MCTKEKGFDCCPADIPNLSLVLPKPNTPTYQSTGWTLASTLAYGIYCIPIAD